MFQWKVEDMALVNERKAVEGDKGTYIYKCEKASREEKIEFVDKMQEGKLSYLVNLADKFQKEKDEISKNKKGEINTNSLKAWVKRNDTRSLIDIKWRYGTFNFLSTQRDIMNINQSSYTVRYDSYDNFVDEVFHRQLVKCEEEERKYFLSHDEYSILKAKFREKQSKYPTTFGVYIWDCSDGRICVAHEDGDKERDITIQELRELLDKYAQLEELEEKLTAETHIVY